LDATACEIERSPDGTTGWVIRKAFAITGYTFSDTGLSASTTYYYRFRFRNGDAVVTANSPVKSATTPAGGGPAPLPPTNIRVTAYATAVDIEWDPSPSPAAEVAGYNVYRRAPGGEWPPTPLNRIAPLNGVILNTKFRDETAGINTTYEYEVRAVAP
jgi:hypothetical protein